MGEFDIRLQLAAMAAGFFLDLLLGDPQGRWHPVCAIGTLISRLESLWRGWFPKTEKGELKAGGGLVLSVLAVTGVAAGGILYAASLAGPVWEAAVQALMVYYLLATRSLGRESRRVYVPLREGNLKEARKRVSMIVGRDTECLDADGVARAAVETVAENTSDGIVAPLFYLALGGPVFGWLYKAVNTMDSMVGYKNETYLYFGRAAARLDDLVNFIPARISALLLVGISWALPGFDGAGAYRIWRRDRRNHKSPNSAQTEAACAGALGIRLAGDAWYFGTLVKKPFIGDDDRPVQPEDILRAGWLMYGAALAAFVLAFAVRGFLL